MLRVSDVKCKEGYRFSTKVLAENSSMQSFLRKRMKVSLFDRTCITLNRKIVMTVFLLIGFEKKRLTVNPNLKQLIREYQTFDRWSKLRYAKMRRRLPHIH